MDALEAIRKRRSVRRYTDRPVADADVDTLLRLALLAPTGGMAQAWSLLVVRDPNRLLQREGNNLLTADGNDAALETVTKPSIRTGWLEGSGTDSIGELVQLIEAQRAFETYQKLVSTTMNEVNKKAVSEIAG